MIKKILITIILIILVAIGIFLYATRPAAAPSQSVDSATIPNSSAVSSTATTSRIYRISQSESLVEFRIGEILNSNPKTVIGTTTEVAGVITISRNSVMFGPLAVNARTFKTDSEKRDGAIARFILKSEEDGNEFMTFTPKMVTGVPATIATTTTLNLIVSGDLTIAGMTKPATFAVVMKVADDALTGTATLKLKRADFGLKIPEVKSVAGVDEEFTVTATIKATRVSN
ncbi:MAG: YceI family protein [Patescibacteria group bacterium]